MWNAFLKVRLAADTIPEPKLATIGDAINKYTGDSEVVIVLENGLFIPQALVDKSLTKCSFDAPPTTDIPVDLTTSNVKTLGDLKYRRIVSIGDLHGDLEQTKKVLQAARLVNKDGKWVGGKTIVVQTGDTIDRGPDLADMFKYLYALQLEAIATGGKLILLNGNHETMLLTHDYSYVKAEDLVGPKKPALETAFSLDPDARAPTDPNWPKYVKTPASPTMLTGELTKLVSTRAVVCKVGDNVFVHGGITPEFATNGVVAINKDIRDKYMEAARIGKAAKRLPEARTAIIKLSAVFDDLNGPLWYRGYATNTETVNCQAGSDLLKALASLQAKRMIIGHTPTDTQVVKTQCDGKLVMQDIAISRYMAYANTQTVSEGNIGFTEIYGDSVKAYTKRGWMVSAGTDNQATGAFTWPKLVEPPVTMW
jgi:hypothetical protein